MKTSMQKFFTKSKRADKPVLESVDDFLKRSGKIEAVPEGWAKGRILQVSSVQQQHTGLQTR